MAFVHFGTNLFNQGSHSHGNILYFLSLLSFIYFKNDEIANENSWRLVMVSMRQLVTSGPVIIVLGSITIFHDTQAFRLCAKICNI